MFVLTFWCLNILKHQNVYVQSCMAEYVHPAHIFRNCVIKMNCADWKIYFYKIDSWLTYIHNLSVRLGI